MPKHLFSSLAKEYTLVIAFALARILPKACQGNYFLQIGKNTCKNFILFGACILMRCVRILFLREGKHENLHYACDYTNFSQHSLKISRLRQDLRLALIHVKGLKSEAIASQTLGKPF